MLRVSIIVLAFLASNEIFIANKQTKLNVFYERKRLKNSFFESLKMLGLLFVGYFEGEKDNYVKIMFSTSHKEKEKPLTHKKWMLYSSHQH